MDLRVELTPEKARAIAELGYGTNTKVVAGFRRRAWRDLGYSGAIFSGDSFGGFERAFPGAARPTAEPPGRAGRPTL